MKPREYWAHYVAVHGGPTKVAERLKIPFSTIAAVSNGTRGIGKDLANRLHQADPMLDPKVLIWITADKSKAAA